MCQNGGHNQGYMIPMDMGENHKVNVNPLKVATNRKGCRFIYSGAFKSCPTVYKTCFSAFVNQETTGPDASLLAQFNNKISTTGQITAQFLKLDYPHGSPLPFFLNCRRAPR